MLKLLAQSQDDLAKTGRAALRALRSAAGPRPRFGAASGRK